MSKIEWLQRPGTIPVSWNFISGCTKKSPGCDNCWALSMSWRLQNNQRRPDRYEGVVEKIVSVSQHYMGWSPPHDCGIRWTGRINLDYDALEAPYRWKKPRTVFVASMSDLFHPKVPDDFITRAFATMKANRQHTFLILTKRAKRMKEWFDGYHPDHRIGAENIWLMVTAENQEQADLRILYLLQAPAAVRGVSVEPMLGAINLGVRRWLKPYPTRHYDKLRANPYTGKDRPLIERPRPGLDWVVIGAESGPNARQMEGQWAKDLIKQCDAASVPVFCKQTTANGQVSKNPNGWPVELQRREWPK